MAKKAQRDWRYDYEAQRAREREDALTDLTKVCKTLVRLGVKTVTIEYDGCGDSGCIEHISFDPERAASPRLVKISGRIEHAAYQFLPDGWELNAGSYGEITIDVKSGKMHREHSWRVESFETDEEDFDLTKGGK